MLWLHNPPWATTPRPLDEQAREEASAVDKGGGRIFPSRTFRHSADSVALLEATAREKEAWDEMWPSESVELMTGTTLFSFRDTIASA
jgi:hypothetical protein